MTLRDESRITLSVDQALAQLEGEAVVLDLRDGVYFGLNPVAARVWSLLKEAPRASRNSGRRSSTSTTCHSSSVIAICAALLPDRQRRTR